MVDYRKLIPSQDYRTKVLSTMNWVPDRLMLGLQYFIQTGKILRLDHPHTFNEKLQAYKYFHRDPVMLKCTDKVEVRDYVKEKGLEEILVPVYGIYDKVEDIDYSELPEEFVAKTSDGGGGSQVFICEKKNEKTKEDLEKNIEKWMSAPKPKKHIAREWAYDNGYPRRIIIEKLLHEEGKGGKDIIDYKFFCFDGKFKILQIHKDRYIAHKLGFWDENLNFLPGVWILYPCFEEVVELPSNIREMVKVAEKLAEGFPFVRVDLYNIDGKIYFSELTFYPASGYLKFEPTTFDERLSSYFNFPRKNNKPS